MTIPGRVLLQQGDGTQQAMLCPGGFLEATPGFTQVVQADDGEGMLGTQNSLGQVQSTLVTVDGAVGP